MEDLIVAWAMFINIREKCIYSASDSGSSPG